MATTLGRLLRVDALAQRYRVIGLSTLGIWSAVAVPTVAAQDVPRMRSAVWILNHYLSDRHTLTGTRPDVLVCADGIPGEWRSGIESWVPSSRERHSSSITMRESCPEGPGGLDTLYIREITPVVDSFLAMSKPISATTGTVRYGGMRTTERPRR